LLAVRRAWWIVVVTVLAVAVAAWIGRTAESHLSAGGFAADEWESSGAQAALAAAFPDASPNLVLLVTARSGTVSDPSVAAAGAALTERLAREPGVTGVSSYWSTGLPELRSVDNRQALVLGVVSGDDNTVRATTDRVTTDLDGSSGPIAVTAGGTAVIESQIVQQSADDLHRAELVTFPVIAVLLLIFFGSAVGAALPLVVGGVAIVGSLCLLRLLASVTEVSALALNITSGMCLGLGVDYSLLMVSRYREELRRGYPRDRALVRTLQTAGRTVLFSAVTVAIGLASLAIFPIPFLRSFAFAGTGVVVLAAGAAVVVLPAVLYLLGARIESGRLWGRAPATTPAHFWYRRAQAVMRRPLLVTATVLAVLVVMGLPFLRIALGDDDERILPASSSAKVVGDALRTRFASDPAWTIRVVAEDAAHSSSAAIDDYAARLSGVSGVARVDAVTGHYARGARTAPADASSAAFTSGGATWLAVVPSAEPLSPMGARLVRDIRAAPAPFGVMVGGGAAVLVDSQDSMLGHLPLVVAVIVVATVVLLFLMVGAIVVPLKTLLLNVVSLSATFGALVFVFQDGHLAGPLGFTPTDTISVRTPILLFCFAFGLSMDYEVFLISRIKEEYDRVHDNREAVALGLQHTGRVVTSAAVLIAVVFLALLTSSVTTIKIMGLGLALAVLVDAFLVRATLVPALMRLLGDRNWWAPRPLRRLHLLVGIWEREPLAILDVGVPVRLATRRGERDGSVHDPGHPGA